MAPAVIPLDIISEIFSKLPAKILCRFKCLSKSFAALTTNPWFVKMHQARNQTQTLVFAGDNNTLLCTGLDGKMTGVYTLDLPIKNNLSVLIDSCCNGLLCLSVKDESGTLDYFVYNCSIRELKRIPNYEPFDQDHRKLVGLGYADSTDEYKVVGVTSTYRFGKVEIGVHVFSSRNNTWKTFETIFDVFANSCWTSCLNGTIHFGFCEQNMIAAFDLEEDKFKFLGLPAVDELDDSVDAYSVSVIGGCICLSPYAVSGGTKDFWIMKEYGVTESWTRISLVNSIHYLKPLCSMKDSEFILCALYEKFVLLNPKDGTFKDFVIDGLDIDPIEYSLAVYTESLISTNTKSEKGALNFGAGAVELWKAN